MGWGRVLTHHTTRALLRLRLIIQTSLLGSYMRKVREVQEESILADGGGFRENKRRKGVVTTGGHKFLIANGGEH